MIVGFWSNVKGQSGTTSNLLASSIMLAMESVNCCILESTFVDNNLSFDIVGEKPPKSNTIFDDIGIDSLLRLVKSGQVDKESLNSCTISLLNKKFNYIPATTKTNKELFYKDLMENVEQLLGELDKIYDIVLIDIGAGLGDSIHGFSNVSLQILELCDYVIVNISQNLNVVNQLFLKYSLPWDKVLFVVGMYDKESIIKDQYLIKKYKPYISKNNLFVVPYNTGFKDSMLTSDAVKYISKNRNNVKNSKDNTQYFMNSISRLAAAIYSLFSQN